MILSMPIAVSPLYPPGPAAKFLVTASSVPVKSSLALPIESFPTGPSSFVVLPTSWASCASTALDLNPSFHVLPPGYSM